MRTKLSKLFIILSISYFFLLSAAAAEVNEKSISEKYPELKPLVDFVGEEELSVLHLVGFKAAKKAMDELDFERGSSDILALTDAGYMAKVGEYTTEKALDGLMMTSGLSRGKNNLLNIHKPYNSPLWFAFFNKDTKECLYLEVNMSVLKKYIEREKKDRFVLEEFMKLEDEEIFAKISKENIDANKLLENPEEWQEKMKAKVFGGNEFSIITICNVWAYKELPSDFARAVELHDHICPGLTSGYLIAKYVEKNFPTKYPRYEYIVIAIPPWCKDDAIIQYFETNVGHKRLFVKWLTGEQKKEILGYLPEELKDYSTADIFIRWEKGKPKGEGILVGFNWSKFYEETKPAGVSLKEYKKWIKDFKTWRWWWVRLRGDLYLADYMEKPEEFVTIMKRFDVNNQTYIEKLESAGVNPLVEIGLMPKPTPEKIVEVIPSWVYFTMGVLVVVAAVMGGLYVKSRKS